MRRPPRPPVRLGIKTLDQRDLIRPLPVQEVPPMLLARPDGKRLPHPIRVDELHGQKVAVGHGARVGDAERVFEDGLDGPPDVDDLNAALKEALRFLGKVAIDTIEACFVGLVNMHALDGPSERLGFYSILAIKGVFRLATDCVVEDEDLGCAGAVRL